MATLLLSTTIETINKALMSFRLSIYDSPSYGELHIENRKLIRALLIEIFMIFSTATIVLIIAVEKIHDWIAEDMCEALSSVPTYVRT